MFSAIHQHESAIGIHMPGVLQVVGSQRDGHDSVTEQ